MEKVVVISRQPKRKNKIVAREGNVIYPEALQRVRQSQPTPQQLQAAKVLQEILIPDDHEPA